MTTNRPFTIEQAIVWAEDLCSRAEYASGEILERLIRKGMTRSEAARIVEHLIDRRFIDDARFARAFVRDKVIYARWGKRKVAMAMYRKRIARDIINDAISEIDYDTYIEGLARLLSSRLRKNNRDDSDRPYFDIDYTTRQSLYRFAASRGFEPADVSRALAILLH